MNNITPSVALTVTFVTLGTYANANPNPTRSKTSPPKLWIVSTIDTSFYKGPKPLKQALPGRSKWAWPINPKEPKQHRVVHSAVKVHPPMWLPGPGGTSLTTPPRVYTSTSKFYIKHTAAYKPNQYFQWTREPLGGTGTKSGTYHYTASANFRVTPYEDQTDFNIKSSKLSVQGNSKNDTTSITIRWHMPFEETDREPVPYGKGQLVRTKYFPVKETVIEKYVSYVPRRVSPCNVNRRSILRGN